MASPHVNFVARMSTPGGHGADWADRATTKWVNSPAAARLEVKALVPYKPDFIKAFADGWRYGASADNTSMDEGTLTALVDEAHRNQLKVLTHTVTVDRGAIAGGLLLWLTRQPGSETADVQELAREDSRRVRRFFKRLTIALAALLALVFAAVAIAFAAFDVDLGAGIGDRNYVVTTPEQLRDEYHLGIGSLDLDLSRVELPAGETHVDVRVDIGDMDVLVPAGVALHIHGTAEAGEVARDGRDAHRHALERRVAPGLVAAREDAQVTAAHEVPVVHPPERIHRRDELGVVHDLHGIVRRVAEPEGAQVREHRIVLRVVEHVRGQERRCVAPEGVLHAPVPQPPVLLHELVEDHALARRGAPEEPLPHALADAQ